jgi:hypothetical protein
MSVIHEPQKPSDEIAGAVKYDGGKSPIFRGAISYFPKAISGVAAVSHFGATKYAWNGWRGVPDGLNRYTDAMVRHLIAEAAGEVLDPESGLPHAWHVAWGALARAELIELEKESNT